MHHATQLRDRVVRYITHEAGDFGSLALEVFQRQYECNLPYRAFCDARGSTPDTVLSWQQVPTVPTDAFRAAELICGDPAAAEAVFRTSGTTHGSQRRGVHYVLDLVPYHAALRSGFLSHLLPDLPSIRILSLVPRAAELPDSSLSHMVDEVVAAFGTPESSWHISAESGIHLESLLHDLEQVESSGEAVLLAGTSFTFVHLFDALRERGRSFQLPGRSRAMDTGGFKGRSRAVARADLIDSFQTLLGIPAEWLVNEYGMTEMSSQFYDRIAGRRDEEALRYRAPHWVRTIAVDPETLGPLAPGETGVLRHFDLGNLNSVSALQTADLGTVHAHGFTLLGRASGTESRGCSIAMDELLQAIEGR
ncbi:coenzyme F390 synthetase [soil metagenome]